MTTCKNWGALVWLLRWGALICSWGALLTGCSAAGTEETNDLGVLSQAACTGVGLGSDATGVVDGSVRLTASGVACIAGETPEYFFRYRREGTSAFADLRGWSPVPTVDWSTSGLPGGRYRIQVQARAQGASSYQSTRNLYLVLKDACLAPGLQTSAPSPQPAGTTILLNATSQCTAGTAEYQFLLGSSVLRDWDPDPSFVWLTQTVPAGSYGLTVKSRRIGNLDADGSTTLNYRLGETCSAPVLNVSPRGPVALGASVTVSAQTTCTGVAEPEFRFSYRVRGSKTFTLLRDYTGNGTLVWDTADVPANEYQLRVEVRANDYAGPRQALKNWSLNVGGSCPSVSLRSSSPDPLPPGADFLLDASANCTNATPEFRFFYKSPASSEYVEFRGWGVATAVFPTAGLLGEYRFAVQARATGFPAEYQSSAEITRLLGSGCSNDGLTILRAAPASTEIDFFANGSCLDGSTPEYQFFYRKQGARVWTAVRDWGSSDGSWDVTGLTPGSYELLTNIRAQERSGNPEASDVTAYTLCSPGYAVDARGVCSDVDECSLGRFGCDGLTRCTNTIGGHTCTPCPAGYSGEGETGCIPDPTAENQFMQVVTGRLFTCGLRLDGSVRCWGDNWGGVASAVPADHFTKIAAGYFGACGLRSDGGAVCWGEDSESESQVPAGAFMDIAVGGTICGIREDKTVSCWGGPAVDAPSGTFASLSAGRQHVCGLREDGTIACWGWNIYGQATPPAGRFLAVSVGEFASCALDLHGKAQCWGRLEYGLDSPPVGTFTAITNLSATACVLDAAGKIQCWGQKLFEDTAFGSWTSIIGGEGHYCALHANHTVRCWGMNYSGNALPPSSQPLARLSTSSAACSISASGQNRCWATADTNQIAGPLGTFVSVSATTGAACWLAADGTPSCIGMQTPAGRYRALAVGGYGYCGVRLDDGSLACQSRFFTTTGATPPSGSFLSVSTGPYSACAIREDSTLTCWRYESYYPFTPPPAGTFRNVALGGAYACGVLTDGTLACWGDSPGWFGATDHVPAPPSGVFETVAVGGANACGLRADGHVECWGSSFYGDLTPPDERFTQIGFLGADSNDVACGLRTDGTLRCWNQFVR
jgi:hypothetical protein